MPTSQKQQRPSPRIKFASAASITRSIVSETLKADRDAKRAPQKQVPHTSKPSNVVNSGGKSARKIDLVSRPGKPLPGVPLHAAPARPPRPKPLHLLQKTFGEKLLKNGGEPVDPKSLAVDGGVIGESDICGWWSFLLFC